MYCRDCGSTIGASDATCRNCGRVMTPEPAEVTCPRCQGVIGAGADFCTHCGTRIEAASPSTTAEPPRVTAGPGPAPSHARTARVDPTATDTSRVPANGAVRIGGNGTAPRPWAPSATSAPAPAPTHRRSGADRPVEETFPPEASAPHFPDPGAQVFPPAAPTGRATSPALPGQDDAAGRPPTQPPAAPGQGPDRAPRRSAGLRPSAETAASRRAHAEQVDTTSFISESDLPAWLRQVVETEEAESRAAKQATIETEARNRAKAAEEARATMARAAAAAARQERDRAARIERERAAGEAAASRAVVPPPSLPTPEAGVAFDTTKRWSADRTVEAPADDFSLPYATTPAADGGTGKRSRSSSPMAGTGPKVLMVVSVVLIVAALLLLLAPGLFS